MIHWEAGFLLEILEYKRPKIVHGHGLGLGLLVLNLVELVPSEGKELLQLKLILMAASHVESMEPQKSGFAIDSHVVQVWTDTWIYFTNMYLHTILAQYFIKDVQALDIL